MDNSNNQENDPTPQKIVHWKDSEIREQRRRSDVADLIDIIVTNEPDNSEGDIKHSENETVSSRSSSVSHPAETFLHRKPHNVGSFLRESKEHIHQSKRSLESKRSFEIAPPVRPVFSRSPTFEQFYAIFHTEFSKQVVEGETRRVMMAGKHLPKSFQLSSIEEILELDLTELKKNNEVLWIDIDTPSKHDLDQIEVKFGLHPLTTEDILEETREKVENFENYLFVVARELSADSNYQIANNVNIIVFENYVLTIHYHEVESIDQTFYRLKHGHGISKEKIMEHGDWVMYTILDAVVDDFGGHVEAISLEAEALDELVLVFNSDVQNDLLRRIGTARRLYTTLRSHLWSKRELLVNLTTKEYPFLSQGIKIFFRDVLDNTAQMEEKLRSAKEMLNNLHSTYLARISLEMAEGANQVNRIMKKFSAVGTIFIPLTLVAGLFGMNVKVPGMVSEVDNLNWFWGILSIMIAICIVAFSIFYKKGWF